MIVMDRTNLIAERAAEQEEFKKPRSVSSCAHQYRRGYWRDVLHTGMWTQPRKHAALVTTVTKEPQPPYYEHLRSKAQRRGCRTFQAEPFRVPDWILPPKMAALRHAIEKSRRIVGQVLEYDDETIVVSESTWNRAQKFLMKNALKLWRSHKICFDPPQIIAGPEGSIDLLWRTDNRELLINVPAGSEEPIGYYGDDRAEGTTNAVRGKDLESSPDAEWIFLWLTK
jgi:hypothetical protein